MTERNEKPDEAGTRTQPTPPGSVSRRAVLATVGAASLGSNVFPTRAFAATPKSQPGPDAALGPDRSDRLQDEAWVETPVDTNDSGRPDRVYVRVTRPESTDEGEQLPVIATASPYYGEQTHSDATPAMHYDREIAPAAGGNADDTGEAGIENTRRGSTETTASHDAAPPSRLPPDGVLEQRYLPQGYVVARISSLGTHRSTGCYTAAGPETIEALAAVVDWFNGRATAYDAETGGDTVEAHWTSGRTGLIGASANGELANGLATTGVDGLEAIVPQSANNGQFSLFRANGTPISVTMDESPGMADLGTWVQAGNARRPDCGHWTDVVEDGQDRTTGDYNDFWHEREFLTGADAVEAGVLLTHAVDDPIVKPNNFADWHERLQAADVPVKLWLHEGGHTSPRGEAWQNLLDRWWDYWLKDVDNGVVDEHPVTVVRDGPVADRNSMETYESWPVPDTEPTTVRLAGDGVTAGDLTVDEPASEAASFVDDASVTAGDLVSAAESSHRLRYETPALGQSVHVSGQVVPRLSLTLDEPTVVSAALVEYGDGGADVVTRGWADPLNRPSYGEYDSPVAYKESLRESTPLEPDEPVQVEFPLQATDHVFEPGTRVGLVVYATDREVTLHPPGGATVTVSLADSSVALPVVGGETALTDAFQAEPPEGTNSTGQVGPGFGIGTAVAALGSLGYLLRRCGSNTGERRD